MKKAVLSAALMSALGLGLVNAQSKSSAGVKADLNVSNYLISESSNLKYSHKAGFSAGLLYRYGWRENRALEADMILRYSDLNMKDKTTGESADYRYFGVEIPAYHIMYADIDENILYMGIGQFVSYGLFKRYRSGQNGKKQFPTAKDEIYRWNLGLALIVGYETKSRLQFFFNYNMGFLNMVEPEFENINMLTQLISLGVGYRFSCKQ
jgi:hypothetical protein